MKQYHAVCTTSHHWAKTEGDAVALARTKAVAGDLRGCASITLNAVTPDDYDPSDGLSYWTVVHYGFRQPAWRHARLVRPVRGPRLCWPRFCYPLQPSPRCLRGFARQTAIMLNLANLAAGRNRITYAWRPA